jgi:butyryl-CoA dehydrogenase
MFYRDNRLNPIHEGTTGIQSLDLLARKVPSNGMAGYNRILAEMAKTIEEAGEYSETTEAAAQLAKATDTLKDITAAMLNAMMEKNIDLALANSVKYLDLFGHVVIAWIWLWQGIVASKGLSTKPHSADENFYRGKLQAMQYFYRYELPVIYTWAALLNEVDDTCHEMKAEWF